MYPPLEPPAGPFHAVLFDVDGTLIDTADLIIDSLDHACRTHLGRTYPRETYTSVIGIPAPAQLERLGGERGPEMLETALRFYENHLDRERLFAGALDLLAMLSEAGILLGLVTSKSRRELNPALARWPFHSWVRVIVTAELTSRHKPEPDPVYYALQTLRVPAERALFVGDSPFDLRAGRTAGVRTGAACWGPHPRAALQAEAPDYLFGAFPEIRRLCLS